MDTAGKKVRKRGKEKPFLPDEIIRNILIRLPVKSVVRFEVVSREWRDTILARDFVDFHQRNSIPVILVASTRHYGFNIFAIDKWWDLARKRSMIHRFPSCAPDSPYASINQFSHSGLIVLRGSRFWDPEQKFIILNPARPSDECVTINFPLDFKGDICAVYYHPSLKEYCALWEIRIPGISGDQPELIQYKLLNLGSDPSFKMISDAFTYRVKDKDPYHTGAYPLLINDHLYWMLNNSKQDYKFGGRNDILEFDIISEEFMVIPCPIPLNTECRSYETHLLNSDDDGILSLLLILPSTITIWTLKDHELRLWSTNEYTMSLDIRLTAYGVGIIALVDGMLAFHYRQILFVCNLMEGIVKKYPKKYGGDVLFLSHQMSLASLMNCKKDVLYIDKDGEVLV